MGWFSSLFSDTASVSVSSTVYNLAGDELNRSDYLKTTTIGAALKESDDGIGKTVVDSYLSGPGMKLRNFATWCKTNGYDATVGFSQSTLALASSINTATVVAAIPHDAGESVSIQTSEIGLADYTWWVDQYMVEHHPTLVDSNFRCDFDDASKVATILFADGHTEYFSAAGFNASSRYLYATYIVSTGTTTGTLISGSQIRGTPPSTTGWTRKTTGSPGWTTPAVWERTTYQGMQAETGNTSSLYEKLSIWTIETRNAQNVVTATDTYYQLDTRTDTIRSWTPLRVFIYEQGSGNAALDAMFSLESDAGYFLPYIPVRLNNQFISDSYEPAVYSKSKRALDKATGASFTTLVSNISDNSSLGDIDYAYVVFGVSLNVKEKACKRYVYEFFLEVMAGMDMSDASYHSWRLAWEAADAKMVTWTTWLHAQSVPTSLLYGTAEPEKPTYPTASSHSIRIYSGGKSIMNYDMTISWTGLVETRGTGQGKAGAKAGDFWFETVSSETITGTVYTSTASHTVSCTKDTEHTRLWWQMDDNTWRRLDIYDLTHTNLIYGGKSVVIKAKDALSDSSESGFIIPIHEEIFRRLPIKTSTQMATACCFVVFNCYKVVKKKWYETWWFKIILIVVVIAVSVASGGLAGAGLLGSNLAVGTFLGLTGTAALVAGAITNAIAAIVLTTMLQKGATWLFGAKWGALIGSILSVIALSAVSAYTSSGSLAEAFSKMGSAENLIKLTNAVGSGYASFMSAEASEINTKTTNLVKTYNSEMNTLESEYISEFGLGGGVINALDFVDTTLPTAGVVTESVNTFLQRTLLVGSDIADITLNMVHNFADVMTSTELSLNL